MVRSTVLFAGGGIVTGYAAISFVDFGRRSGHLEILSAETELCIDPRGAGDVIYCEDLTATILSVSWVWQKPLVVRLQQLNSGRLYAVNASH